LAELLILLEEKEWARQWFVGQLQEDNPGGNTSFLLS
jgi:hypothetical protein